jgi:peptidoglycan hydrolase-like protein with peptidoglycan-binding domain
MHVRMVAEVQRQLRSRGYYRGWIDGKYGGGTAFAVRAFQSRLGISPTGQVDIRTLDALGLPAETWRTWSRCLGRTEADYGRTKNSNTESGKRSGRSIIGATMATNTVMKIGRGMVMAAGMGMCTVMMTSLRGDSLLRVMLASRD